MLTSNFWLLCLIAGNHITIHTHIKHQPIHKHTKYQPIMNSSSFPPKLQPLKLWTVHSEHPNDPTLSCYMKNNTWFCTDNHILYSLTDDNDPNPPSST